MLDSSTFDMQNHSPLSFTVAHPGLQRGLILHTHISMLYKEEAQASSKGANPC
jgi:hypothetical protein